MTRSKLTRSPGGIGALVLLATVIGSGGLLAAWKGAAIQGDAAASANQPEPMEVVTAATASPREHRPSTTSVGTVLALQSVTLRNELPGTVRHDCQVIRKITTVIASPIRGSAMSMPSATTAALATTARLT